MSVFILIFDLLGFTRIFKHILKVILVKSETYLQKKKTYLPVSNTLLFNSAAINTHLHGKHPEQLQITTISFISTQTTIIFYFGPRAKKKQG